MAVGTRACASVHRLCRPYTRGRPARKGGPQPSTVTSLQPTIHLAGHDLDTFGLTVLLSYVAALTDAFVNGARDLLGADSVGILTFGDDQLVAA